MTGPDICMNYAFGIFLKWQLQTSVGTWRMQDLHGSAGDVGDACEVAIFSILELGV